MTDTRHVECKCTRSSETVGWSYSTDDLFCPGCGVPLARLVSSNQFRPNSGDGPLWVYPTPGNEPRFDVSLLLEYADAERCVQRRMPQIARDQKGKPLITLHGVHSVNEKYFHSRVTVPEPPAGAPNDPSQPLLIRLEPKKSKGEFRVPDNGFECKLQNLSGDFRERELVVRVCNTPSVRIELTGDGMEPAANAGDSTGQTEGFSVTASDRLDVQLRIHAVDAPIVVRHEVNRDTVTCRLVDESPTSEYTQVEFDLKDRLEAGTIIWPRNPWCGNAKLDTSGLVEGQRISLTVQIYAHGARISRKDWKVDINRVDKGGLEISPKTLTVPLMFFGETRSNAMNDRSRNPEGPDATGDPPVIRRLYVRNLGKSIANLGEITRPADAHWLEVKWSRDVAEGSKHPRSESQIELNPGERGEIYVDVDLRTIGEDRLSEDGSLSATVQFRDSEAQKSYEARVLINKVRPRERCPLPLCIDFGNTSSFAAIRNPINIEATPWLKGEIVAVHDLSDSESYPTALFVKSVEEDPLASKYEIGTQAVTEMADLSSHGYAAIVTDLKRWIGSSDHSKMVIDPHGNHRSYDVGILIVMYLRRIIERAEAILRGYTIEELCVSHPSKFPLKRREAFFQIIDRLCHVVTRERGQDGIELKRVFHDEGGSQSHASPQLPHARGIDEANAVAVGAVFEDEIRDRLRSMVSPERPNFTVASFDMGGGSVDIALIRFHVRKGRMDPPQYRTEYLGIGGNDAFGGDQVTFVVFELLKQRIRQALETAGLAADNCLSCIPPPLTKDSSAPERRRNYDVLWRVAEKIKIFQCTHPDVSLGSEEVQALQHSIRPQLLHDLVLDPSPGGSLVQDEQCVEALKVLVQSGEFVIPLDQIYDHSVAEDLSDGHDAWTVRGRIHECIEELVAFGESNGTTIDLVIRCGAGSRLPLVEQMLREQLRDAAILPDFGQEKTKYRVAHGLVRFLDARKTKHDFARSSDYTSSAFAIGTPDSLKDGRIQLIPNCAPVNDPQRKPYVPRSVSVGQNGTVVEQPLTLADLGLYANEILVCRIDRNRLPTIHGWFDLTRPPDDPAGGPGKPLNDELIEELDPRAAVRLTGSERDFELTVETDSGCLGIWKMISADARASITAETET